MFYCNIKFLLIFNLNLTMSMNIRLSIRDYVDDYTSINYVTVDSVFHPDLSIKPLINRHHTLYNKTT